MNLLTNICKTFLACATLLSFSINAQAKGNNCWTFADKTNEKAQKLDFNQVFVKDTTVKLRGAAIFAVVIGLNTTKEKPNELLYKLINNGSLYTEVAVTLTSPDGENAEVLFRFPPNGQQSVVFTFDEKFNRWKCEDDGLKISHTNLCGQTHHFKVAYVGGKTDWQAVDATYQEKTSGACNTNFKLNTLDFSSSSISITGGNLEMKGDASVSITGSIIYNKPRISQVIVILKGIDGRGKEAVFEGAADFNPNTGAFELNAKPAKKFDTEFVMGESQCMIINFCGDTVLLNGSYEPNKGEYAMTFNQTQRPAKYGQCWVFAGKVSDTTQKVNIGDMALNYEIIKDSKTGYFQNAVVLELKGKKENKAHPLAEMVQWGAATAVVEYEITDSKGNTARYKGQFNNHYGALQHYHAMAPEPGFNRKNRITKATITVVNACGTSFILETVYKDGYDEEDTAAHWTENWKIKQTFTDACESNVKLKYSNAASAHVGGLFTTQFELAKGENADVAGAIVLNVEITNCKDEVKYIEVKMTYNEKTQTYTGSMGIPEDKNCTWSATDLKMTVYNQCGDEVFKDKYPPIIIKMKDKIAKGDV